MEQTPFPAKTASQKRQSAPWFRETGGFLLHLAKQPSTYLLSSLIFLQLGFAYVHYDMQKREKHAVPIERSYNAKDGRTGNAVAFKFARQAVLSEPMRA